MNFPAFLTTMSKSTYHIVIISLYICFCTYLFLSIDGSISYYSFENGDLLLLIPFTIFSCITFYLINKLIGFGIFGINKVSILRFMLIIFYACIIAIPEEIIFRGFIQGYFQTTALGIYTAIIVSSVIFGMAHILNQATSFHPKDWNWKLVLMSTFAGLYLGLAYTITKSLIVPTILHILFIIGLKIFIVKN